VISGKEIPMYTNRIAMSFLASAVLVLSVGCGLEAPTTTSVPGVSAVVVTEETFYGPYQATFSSSGGSFGNSAAWFAVSVNALTAPTVLTMGVTTGTNTVATMGPHGRTFANPCTLSFAKPASYDPEDVYYIYLWNETTEEWDELGGVDHGAYVSIAISHFSNYSMMKLVD
jgi:hypothetical protein